MDLRKLVAMSFFPKTRFMSSALVGWFIVFALISPVSMVVCIGESGHLEIESEHCHKPISDAHTDAAIGIDSSLNSCGDCEDIHLSTIINNLIRRSSIVRQDVSLSINLLDYGSIPKALDKNHHGTYYSPLRPPLSISSITEILSSVIILC